MLEILTTSREKVEINDDRVDLEVEEISSAQRTNLIAIIQSSDNPNQTPPEV